MTRRVILVTGASRGIGAAVALAAARAGYAVGVSYRSNAPAAESVAAAIERDGGHAVLLPSDVGDDDSVRKMFAAVDGAFGRLDALVNNAGILEVVGIADATQESLARTYQANVFGTIFCAREAVQRMSTRSGGRGGSIVNISSAAARLGGLGVAYASGKGAVEAFTRVLANEVAAQGIRVNTVRPGLIDTEIHEASGGVASMRERARTLVPLGRQGTPEEVAQAVLWLASDAASYVHGTIVDVAGGR